MRETTDDDAAVVDIEQAPAPVVPVVVPGVAPGVRCFQFGAGSWEELVYRGGRTG